MKMWYPANSIETRVFCGADARRRYALLDGAL